MEINRDAIDRLLGLNDRQLKNIIQNLVKESGIDPEQIRAALDKELSFTDGINSGLVTTILDRIVMKKESTKEEIHLDIYLRLGDKFEAILPSASNNRSRNTMRKLPIRKI